MSAPYQHILIATDFSDSAIPAVELGVDLVHRFAARVSLVHVYDGGIFQRAVAPMKIGREELEAQMASSARSELERLATDKLADAESIDCVPIAAEHPARAIVDHGKEHQVDLIVIGTHGRGGIGRLFAGSVAERVVRLAACDVLVVRSTPATWPPSTIVAATDFSDASQPAISRAAELSKSFEAQLELAHVFDETVPVPLPDGTFESLAHVHERFNVKLSEQAKKMSPRPSVVVLRGTSPAHALTTHAKTVESDLIVVGTHGRTGFAQVLIGSVAERVVRNAPTAALIVRSGQS